MIKDFRSLLTANRRFWTANPRLLMAVKFLSVFAIFAAAAWYKAYDPDLGGHLQAGNTIRESGIPSHDIFT